MSGTITKTNKEISVLTGTLDTSPTPVLVTADADITQLITVANAGTPVQGPDKTNAGGWFIKAEVANTGTIYWMFHGQTKATKGYPLSAGDADFVPVSDLNSIDFDSSVSGEKVWAHKA